MSDKKPKNIFVAGPISPAFISGSIQHHSAKINIGAHSIFLGQVRADVQNGQTVAAIEYTTYEAMALETMHEIREAIFSKYELTCMHVYHSLGKVAAGEISLFVFTSSAHRKAAIVLWGNSRKNQKGVAGLGEGNIWEWGVSMEGE